LDFKTKIHGMIDVNTSQFYKKLHEVHPSSQEKPSDDGMGDAMGILYKQFAYIPQNQVLPTETGE
jgi:hypothetical protein